MAKHKRNYYKLLFYLLLSLIIAYILLQARKKEVIEQEYITFNVAKKSCPVTLLLAGTMLVVDKSGITHTADEWFKKHKITKRR
ncbi:MAG: hypothetical protein PHY56_06265 [Candidatus Omnitrophica bacterium]|nr:hypothetical protein [Candidatus Omnitrophota bacterium]